MRRIYHNRTNSCDVCKISFGDAAGHPHREYDKKGDWTGRWLCSNCYNKDRQKNDPNSQRNIIKSVRNSRTGNLDPDSKKAKGDMFQKLTCIWRKVEDLNIKYDNFGYPIDHSRDIELGIVQTKGRLYNIYGYWPFGALERERCKNFDYLICYCASKDGKIIERIYIFPKEEVIKRTEIKITKNPSRGGNGKNYDPWYEEYRVKDEVILKRVNDIWTKILQDEADQRKPTKSALKAGVF